MFALEYPAQIPIHLVNLVSNLFCVIPRIWVTSNSKGGGHRPTSTAEGWFERERGCLGKNPTGKGAL